MCYHYSQLYGKKKQTKKKPKLPPPTPTIKKIPPPPKNPTIELIEIISGKKSAHACMKQYTVSVYDLCQKIHSLRT